MQSILTRLAAGATALTLALTLTSHSAAAQAGLSFSNVNITDYSNLGNNANSCGHSNFAAVTNESTAAIPNCGAVAGGTAAAITSATNATRTASAWGTATQPGTQGQEYAAGHGFSTQYSQLAVTGTPSPTDNLVFHFLTTQSVTGDQNSNSGYGVWILAATGGTNVQYVAQQVAGVPLFLTSGVTQTANGFDFMMPFTAANGLFQYNFSVDAYGYVTGHATGNVTQTGSLSATLGGIDWTDASGGVVGSAAFDQRGFGTISAAGPVGPPSTVPEPSSMALLGTGLVALVPSVRRRRRR